MSEKGKITIETENISAQTGRRIKPEILAALLLSVLALGLCLWGINLQDAGVSVSYEAAPLQEVSCRPQEPDGTVSINMGELEELTQLKGVGETLASNILTEREANGSFYYPEDILAVKGIGEKKLEGFRQQLDMSLPAEEEN